MDVPDGARIVLFQEDKFKNYHNELHWALSEYDKVVSKVIPVTALVLRPHFRYCALLVSYSFHPLFMTFLSSIYLILFFLSFFLSLYISILNVFDLCINVFPHSPSIIL